MLKKSLNANFNIYRKTQSLQERGQERGAVSKLLRSADF